MPVPSSWAGRTPGPLGREAEQTDQRALTEPQEGPEEPWHRAPVTPEDTRARSRVHAGHTLVCDSLCHLPFPQGHLPFPAQTSTPLLLVGTRSFYLEDDHRRLEPESANVFRPQLPMSPSCWAFLFSFLFSCLFRQISSNFSCFLI